MDSIRSQHLRLLLQVIFFFIFSILFFFSHTKKLIVQVVRSRPHVFFNEEFLFCLYFGNIFFLYLKKKKIHHSIFVVVFFRSQGINKASDMLRLVEKKEVVVYRQQTNCTWGKKMFCFLGCTAGWPALSFVAMIFFSFVCISDSDIYCLLFLGTAVSRRFKTSNNQDFFLHTLFSQYFFFFQFRMNNQLINICLFVFNSSFSFSEISHLQAVLPKLSL